MRNQQATSENYRPEIDGLRAIAVIAVVFYHFGIPGFNGGYVGVDVFFVISGFLITRIIITGLNTETFSLQNFYVKRARRILPAFFVMILVTTLASLVFLTPSDLMKYGESLFASSTFWSNYFFLKETGYFSGPSYEMPILHTWSLSLEEQFYILMPIFIVACYRVEFLEKYIKHIIISLLILSLLIAEMELSSKPERAFFSLHTRFWELALGSAIALGVVRKSKILYLNTALSLLGLGLIIFAIYFYDNNTPFPGLTALAPCVGAALLIIFSDQNTPLCGRILSSTLFVAVGLISYSLYLWHWPIFAYLKINTLGDLSKVETLLAISTSFAIAALSWRYIETPFRRAPSATQQRQVTMYRAISAIALFASAGLLIDYANGFPQRVSADVIAADISPKFERGHTRDCHEKPKGDGFHWCSFGAKIGERYDIILWGDSHAKHYLPAIAKLAKRNGWSGYLISSAGCPPLVETTKVVNGIPNKECANHTAQAISSIRKLAPRYVLLASRWSRYTEHDLSTHDVFLVNGGSSSANLENSKNVFKASLKQTINLINSLSSKVLILGQVPEFKVSVGKCVARRLMNKNPFDECVKIQREVAETRLSFTNSVFNELTKSPIGVYFFRPLEHMCDSQYCYATKDNVILYQDGNHLNGKGSIFLSDFIVLDIPTSRSISSE